MASKIAIVGDANTGKSWSRQFIEDGEGVFLVHPSEKLTYLNKKDGSPVDHFLYAPASAGGRATLDSWEKIFQLPTFGPRVSRPAQALEILDREYSKIPPATIRKLLTADVLNGNTLLVNEQIKDVGIVLKFVSKWMPWIKTIIIPDFTHFISAVVSASEFIDRRAGNEAYQKFWELSADALNTFILSIDNLRRDLVVVIEFHTSYDEKRNRYELFTPAGNMLREKFKPESYFDVMLFTDVQPIFNNLGEESSDYRFVTRRTSTYPQARSSDLFETLYIPNNLDVVLKEFRKKKNIPEAAEDKAVGQMPQNMPTVHVPQQQQPAQTPVVQQAQPPVQQQATPPVQAEPTPPVQQQPVQTQPVSADVPDAANM